MASQNTRIRKRRRIPKKKAMADFYFLLLIVIVVAIVILVGEFVAQYFSSAYKLVNIKGQINLFMVNDDEGTELISILNSKTADVKHIELLGRYGTDGLSEEKSQYIDPVRKTMDSAFAYYDFSLIGPRPVSFQTGVPNIIQDSTRMNILGCGVAAPDQITLRWPSSSKRITSGFGGRELDKGVCDCHGGIDIGGENEDVYAAAGGTVKDVYKTCTVGDQKCNDGYGNYVVVEHKIGLNTYRTYYDHLKEVYVNVSDEVGYEDPKVSPPKSIGKSGNTGFSLGAHLHFEIRKYPYAADESSVDPCSLFKDVSGLSGLSCDHEPVSACKYVSGMITGKSVRGYETDIPLPGAKSGTSRGKVVFKQWG